MPNRKKLRQSGTDGGINPNRNGGTGRLRRIIQNLPPQYRIVLVLRDMEGFSDEEVTAIAGLRSGTVRAHLHRARLLLRDELMKGVKPRGGKAAAAQPSREPPTPARCKARFAELSDYLDGQLDASLSKELKLHLKGCPSCRSSLATLKATVEQCRKSPAETLNRERTARLGAKVLADYERTVAKKARR
ncbi:MAG: sigma factor-like helix-turn-helix DNA-binding protein [Terriglobales bacterium]|jgi:Sigma-70, region 4/Putative zinc-finger